MSDQERLAEYAARLYERRHEGVIVGRARVNIDDWQVTEHECHANVTIWCQHHPKHTPVRGWLYFDLAGDLPYVWFNPHSVIATEAGELVDITPSRASQQYPFIRAEENEQEYARLITERDLRRLIYYK